MPVADSFLQTVQNCEDHVRQDHQLPALAVVDVVRAGGEISNAGAQLPSSCCERRLRVRAHEPIAFDLRSIENLPEVDPDLVDAPCTFSHVHEESIVHATTHGDGASVLRRTLVAMIRRMKRPLVIPFVILLSACASQPAPRAVIKTAVVAAEAFPAPADLLAPPEDAATSSSGLQSRILKEGNSDQRPSDTSLITFHYTGWMLDGKMFDTTRDRNVPSEAKLMSILPGLREGIQLMRVGEERRFWIPANLTSTGRVDSPDSPMVFDVELLAMTNQPTVPSDVAAPPADAEKTSSGLASKVLQPGTGTKHPTASSSVTVHYSGWTTDGAGFDSSVKRGTPATFPLNRVIAGWTEGLQLMVEGEKRRFWIPESLAYQGRAGSPAGMLVFDVELISISN